MPPKACLDVFPHRSPLRCYSFDLASYALGLLYYHRLLSFYRSLLYGTFG